MHASWLDFRGGLAEPSWQALLLLSDGRPCTTFQRNSVELAGSQITRSMTV